MKEQDSSLEAAAKIQNDKFLKNFNNCDIQNFTMKLELPSLSQYDKTIRNSDYHR